MCSKRFNPDLELETDKKGGWGKLKREIKSVWGSGKLKRNKIVYKGVGKFFAK